VGGKRIQAFQIVKLVDGFGIGTEGLGEFFNKTAELRCISKVERFLTGGEVDFFIL
jgi:hypothetical protein